MARLSRRYTQERFGKTISMYIPMYITNSCTNSCIYCGFNHHNKFDRVILTMEQIEDECKAIRALGPFENLLLVTGENPGQRASITSNRRSRSAVPISTTSPSR